MTSIKLRQHVVARARPLPWSFSLVRDARGNRRWIPLRSLRPRARSRLRESNPSHSSLPWRRLPTRAKPALLSCTFNTPGRPRSIFSIGPRGLNPRHSPCKGDVLPLSYASNVSVKNLLTSHSAKTYFGESSTVSFEVSEERHFTTTRTSIFAAPTFEIGSATSTHDLLQLSELIHGFVLYIDCTQLESGITMNVEVGSRPTFYIL